MKNLIFFTYTISGFNIYLSPASDHFLSSADNLSKQFGPKSSPTKFRALPGTNLFDTLVVFLKKNLKK